MLHSLKYIDKKLTILLLHKKGTKRIKVYSINERSELLIIRKT